MLLHEANSLTLFVIAVFLRQETRVPQFVLQHTMFLRPALSSWSLCSTSPLLGLYAQTTAMHVAHLACKKASKMLQTYPLSRCCPVAVPESLSTSNSVEDLFWLAGLECRHHVREVGSHCGGSFGSWSCYCHSQEADDK